MRGGHVQLIVFRGIRVQENSSEKKFLTDRIVSAGSTEIFSRIAL